MTDLVERVAEAVCTASFYMVELTEAEARAAIAVVLDEAAIKLESDFQDFVSVAPSAAAAAIRALNPKER